MVFSLELEKRIDKARRQARWELEQLLFGYAQEYPPTIQSGYDRRNQPVYVAGPQNKERLFRLWASYAVTLCDIHRNEGAQADAGKIVADVMKSCRTVVPALDLSHNAEFREYIFQAVNTSFAPAEAGAAARKRAPKNISRAGQRILLHIESNHLRREDFARTVGVTSRTLQTIIAKGRGRPASERAIAEAMSVRVQDLFPPRH